MNLSKNIIRKYCFFLLLHLSLYQVFLFLHFISKLTFLIFILLISFTENCFKYKLSLIIFFICIYYYIQLLIEPIRMLDQMVDSGKRTIPLIYIMTIGFFVLLITSYDTISSRISNYKSYELLKAEINQGPKNPKRQIPFQDFLPLLYHIPFKGQWSKSVRRSNMIIQQYGQLQISAIYNSSRQTNKYDLKIVLYDGQYRDSQFFDIIIAGDQLNLRQKFDVKGEVFYETMFPIIGLYRTGKTFMYSSYEPLYINKIKIKIDSGEQLIFQLLLSSQYNINVVAQDLVESFQTFYQILFAILLILQNCLVISGIQSMLRQFHNRKQAAEKYSIFGFLCATVWDTVLTMYVYALSFQNQKSFSIFIIPALLASFQIMILQMNCLQIMNKCSHNFSDTKFYLTVYGCLILGCIIAYVSNLQFVFIVSSVLIIAPQIYRNFLIGHRLKNQFNNYLLFSLPRYIIMYYMRAFPANIFKLQPHYLEVLFCTILLGIQIGIIYLQKQYGVRAIVPKFMHISQFKYFMNEPLVEETDCTICLNKLKQFPIFPILSGETINKTCRTPCGHNFHVRCLAGWMQSKLQCPNCRRLLPPIQQCQ